MKKILVVMIVLIAAFALVACGGDDNGAITSVEDLATATIGVQRDTTGHIFVDENFPDATVDAFTQGGDAVWALLSGTVDAVVIDSLPAARFVFANQGQLKILDAELTQEYYGIAFPLGSSYTALFDNALNQLRANGTMDAIYDYWINENPEASRYVTPAGTAHPNGVLLMGTDAGFEPFEFMEGNEIVGFDVCLVRAIGDVLGYQIEIINMDFGSIILAVQTGQVDFGMAGMTIRDDRREHVDFTQGYFNASQVAIVRVP
ncbi:MAG: transporter substrate-binding domain-containing protein [Oscillospiraceae bacterium]|nr:transporter substrate-binding domain-containing protein [Oscillospiraceae bacterium]